MLRGEKSMKRKEQFEVDPLNFVDHDEEQVNDFIREDYEFLTEALGFDPFADADEVENEDLEQVAQCDTLAGAERRYALAHEVERGDECRVDEILAKTV
jgi:hypothetical protein